VNFLFSGSTSRPQFSRYLRKYWTEASQAEFRGEGYAIEAADRHTSILKTGRFPRYPRSLTWG
jgi:hypothetical protein